MLSFRRAMEINIVFEGALESALDAKWLERIAARALSSAGAGLNSELSIVIVGQETIQRLNREYRKIDEPTDVLSFGMTAAGGEPFLAPPDGLNHLGEVIISYPQAVSQAQEHGHPVNTEIAVLAIHGILHLLGYDHEQEAMAAQMRRQERALLESIREELIESPGDSR